MTNFKCFRDKELNLNEDIVTVRGRNGAGKTTIADAILFCLFGKNVEGQSDLELFKTRENGKVVPNLDHSVELTLTTNATTGPNEISLKRSIKEVWVKKRGSEESVFKNNTCEYYVNGESYTKADYEKYISNLVDERVFRAITNPNYFPSLKWQDQREFLTRMVGSIEPECIANTDELVSLVHALDNSNDDIVSYLKHLKYQIKQIKDKLDKIPVRLEEQFKALPERLDWDNVANLIEQKKNGIALVDQNINAIKQGNGSQVRRADLLNQISATTAAIDKKAFDARGEETRVLNEKNKAVSEMTIKFNETLGNQKLMEQTIEADKRMIARCEETVKDCEAELQHLRDIWPNRKFEVDPNAAYCQTCGQLLPGDMVEEKIDQMRKTFNEALEKEKQSLRDKAAKVKKDKEDAESERKFREDKLAADNEQLTKIKEEINTIFANKAKLEKEPVKTSEEILAEDAQYVELSNQLSQLKTALGNLSDSDDNREKLTELEATKAQYEAEITNLQNQLATRQQYDKITSLIKGINEEQKDLVKQLSELEKQEDVARQYQFRQNQLLEERINKHFSLVQWRLFRTVNNGGDSFEEPFCECYVNGIPYHAGLNQAARLNAGLDIINALCKFYNVSAPICLDNSESCINIMQTAGQQVRLQVTDTDLQLV